MRNNITLLDINLRLFDGAAGAAAAGGEGAPAGDAAAQSGAGALPKAETNRRRGSSRRGKTGDLSNIVFGSQDVATSDAGNGAAPAAGEPNGAGNANTSGVRTTSDALEARRAAFDALIDGEYKTEFSERVQQIINRRFKETKGLETTIESHKPIMDMLMQRYGVADGDVKKLQTAIEQDTAYWEAAAEERGMSVEQFKAIQKLERENAEFAKRERERLGRAQAEQQFARWMSEGEQLKALYPSFDLRKEAENPQFMKLLKAGIPVQHAYQTIHMDEITTAAAKNAAKIADKQMIAKLQGNAARPLENGTSSQSAAIVKNDVHNLTRAERAEAVRRAQRGDKITFRGNR